MRWILRGVVAGFVYIGVSFVVPLPDELSKIVAGLVLGAGVVVWLVCPREIVRGLNGERRGSRPEDYLDP